MPRIRVGKWILGVGLWLRLGLGLLLGLELVLGVGVGFGLGFHKRDVVSVMHEDCQLTLKSVKVLQRRMTDIACIVR